MKIIIWALLLILSISNVGYSQELRVIVKNIVNNKGNLLIGIYNSPESFLKETYADTLINMEAVKDSLIISFFNIEPQRKYAISMYQDTDKNNKLNRWLFGIPTERYGFSNDARGYMGPPSFKSSEFYFRSDTTILIKLY